MQYAAMPPQMNFGSVQKLFIGALVSLMPSSVFAQGGPVQQSGLIRPGHIPLWIMNSAVGSTFQGKVNELGITNSGGQPFCIDDAPTSGPYPRLCLGALSQGAGIVSNRAHNGALELPLNHSVNGEIGSFGKSAYVGYSSKQGALWWNGTEPHLYKGGQWVLIGGGDGSGTWSPGPPGPPGQTGPHGPPGQAATVTLGATLTDPPGTNAPAANTGTPDAAVSNFNIPQGVPGPPGPQGPPGTGAGAWTAVVPSGGEDSGNINAALAAPATHGVILDGGIFQVCSTVTVPRDKALIGTRTGMYYSGSGGNPNPWPGTASVWCPKMGSFDGRNPSLPAASMFFMHDNSLLEGFAVTGLRIVSGQTDKIACISATNTQGITVRNMVVANCSTGLRLYSDGAVAGDQGNIAQEMNIHDNTFWWSVTMIDMETVNRGTGCTDFRIHDNEFEVPYYAAIQMYGCLGFQIQNNRIEDGNDGIITNESQGIISGNSMNNLSGPMNFTNSGGTYGLLIADNSMANSGRASSNPCITISGPLSGTTFSNNHCLYGYPAAFKSDATDPKMIRTIMIKDLPMAPIGGPAFFADAVTDRALRPWTLPLLIPGSPWKP